MSGPFSASSLTPVHTVLPGDDALFFVYLNTIWKSDGTAEGTQLVKAIDTTHSYAFTMVGDLLFFVADVRPPNSGANYEVWRTDGTEAGTFQVKDINPSLNADLDTNNPFSLVGLGSRLIFNAVDLRHGQELWRSDGSSSGTTLVKDINPFKVPQASYPNPSLPGYRAEPIQMAAQNGMLFFNASTPYTNGLWRTSGTSATTTLVHEINYSGHIYGLTTIQNQLYFMSVPDLNGYTESSLWDSTGQPGQTTLVGELNPLPTSRYAPLLSQKPNLIRYTDGKTVFNSYDYLWETNGLSTTLVRRMNGTADDLPFSVIGDTIIPFKEGLLFAGGVKANCDRFPNYQLWMSDANGTNPRLIKSLGTISIISHPDGSTECIISSSYPHDFVVIDSLAFYSLFNPEPELWRTDGTEAGTYKLVDLVGNPTVRRLGGMVYFVGTDGDNGSELWRSDGTITGTVVLKDLYVGRGGSSPDDLIVVDDTLFFTALTPQSGRELWKTDGTSQGTIPVAEIAPGAISSNPTGIRPINGYLIFAADDGQTGYEPWMSDGTASGTVLLDDIVAGAEGSNPADWTHAGDYLYFTVDAGIERRLWAIKLFKMHIMWLPIIQR